MRCLARLALQLGCRVIFCCHDDIQPLIRGVIYHGNYDIRCEFRTVHSHDEMILLTPRILDDDLFVVISARSNSVSYTDEVTEMPALLQRNFSGNNLVVIFPEQFGEEVALTTFVDPMSTDLAASPSPFIKALRSVGDRLRRMF